jgi:hypothetical protein
MRFAAALDPPGETKRQAWTLAVWVLFLGAAVIVAALVGTHAPQGMDSVTLDEAHSDVQADVQAELSRSRAARLRVALVLGLLAPIACTLMLSRWHRRNGGYPRGISVEVTETELRILGRGYGSRVALEEATVEERLVDVYAGRLGAWRQVRLRLRTKHQTLELASPARPGDELTLHLEGGEADCIEIAREDYDALKRDILQKTTDSEPPQT